MKNDNSENDRKEKCFELLADIQSTIDVKIAELNKTQNGDERFVQICRDLGKYLDDHNKEIKDCNYGNFTYIYEIIKSLLKDELAKSTNYINCIDQLTSEKKNQIEKENKADVAQRAGEDGIPQLRDPVKEDPAKSQCADGPCNTEHSGNQAGDSRNKDNLGKDGEGSSHHIPGSSELSESSDKLVPFNPVLSAREVDSVSSHTGQEGTKSAVHVAGNHGAEESHTGSIVSLQGRTHQGSYPNGDTHAQGSGKGRDLSGDAQAESETNVSPPTSGEETLTDQSLSLVTSSTSLQELDGSILQLGTKRPHDHLPLSVATLPVAQPLQDEKPSPTQEKLSSQLGLHEVKRKSDEEDEPQKEKSQEQINSQAENTLNVENGDLSTPMQEQEITSFKTYLIIILASLGVMLLSILLIKFTSLGRYFRRKKNEKRQKMREELDRIMYTPSNFEEDNIYLSYSQPEYSSYYAEYDN
ncbi:PIR Superfamily Protein [Plasmodium ovale wallikeri]|uniref:PIR Superfamily Protein n=1 Tax=Plasmodium ovale wallikeri TaxID=864142 RepID=A0A1A9ARK6_PLAOA|nr:PIR Superfamily Protein [Plasmodium ovale wallikeri]SBT58847.1 PIR Superfamily Protein [Plasmodium ovale wallikeri]